MAEGRDYDVVILGGGLAGLSLAVRLAALPHLRTLVIEPRRAYRRDRTWSYWRLHDHPFLDAVTARWDAWEVLSRAPGGETRTARQTSLAHPYEMLPADRLYRSALRIVADAPHVELRLGATASGIQETEDGLVVATPDGPVRAGIVCDSRPPAAGSCDFAQRFLGQEIAVDRPVFDPGRVTLMDFTVPQEPDSVHFLYVLPTSPHEALVEDTWLAPSAAVLPDYRTGIRTYLRERHGVEDYTVAFEEEGAIPMDPALQGARDGGRLIPIGTAGGAVKPSSGYGFLATQRMVDAIAGDLAAGRTPKAPAPRDAVARQLDGIFLHALRSRPADAPLLFHSLFAGCAPEPLIRFLNDVGTPLDVARVAAALPFLPMIAAAGRYATGAPPSG